MSKKDEIKLNVSDVVNYTKLSGAFSSALEEVVRRNIAVEEAKNRGLTASDEELQRSADLFRQMNNLRTADATDEWLAGRGLTLDILENFLEENILIYELKRQLVKEYDKKEFFSTPTRKNALIEAAYNAFLADAAAK